MSSRSSLLGLSLAFVSAFTLAPSVASAHMRVIDPPPRSNADNLKAGGPCGGVPNAGAKKTYFGDMAASPAGGQIKVDLQETVAHSGCYQAWLSTSGQDGQQNQFTKLDQWNDPTGSQGNQSRMINIPTGTKCDRCVLQVIQVMLGGGGGCPQNQMPNATEGLSYYACSDIKIGGGGGADAGPGGDAGTSSGGSSGGTSDGGSSGGMSSGTSGGTTSGGTTSGGAAGPGDDDELEDPSGEGERGRSGLGGNEGAGCSTGGAPVGASSFVLVGVALAAAARRRRAR